MQYMKEINAFYNLMESESLSASAMSLWHTLIHINHKHRWSIEISVSSSVLKLNSGLSESSFQRARKELVDRGLMTYRSRGENLAPAYHLIPLFLMNDEDDNIEHTGELASWYDPFHGDI